ncbi:hypothetical protein [Bacillus velezensis]
MGHKLGDVVSIDTPGGTMQVKIIDVK